MATMAVSHVGYTPSYGAHNRVVDPNFRFCSFCKYDEHRKDSLRFSHWLRDPITKQITCPFLLSTICQICLEPGHTTKNCQNHYKLEEMQMSLMSMSEDDLDAKLAMHKFETEIMRREHIKWYLKLEKNCGFCLKYGDGFHKTHILACCPRLACMTCSYCKQVGHTVSKCYVKHNDEMIANDESDEFILDFTQAEAEERRYMAAIKSVQSVQSVQSDNIDHLTDIMSGMEM